MEVIAIIQSLKINLNELNTILEPETKKKLNSIIIKLENDILKNVI
jgi:hypothetical protein